MDADKVIHVAPTGPAPAQSVDLLTLIFGTTGNVSIHITYNAPPNSNGPRVLPDIPALAGDSIPSTLKNGFVLELLHSTTTDNGNRDIALQIPVDNPTHCSIVMA